MKQYTVGTLAFLDTVFTGLVPVKVVEVIPPGPNGRSQFCTHVISVVTEENRGFRKGERVDFPGYDTVPREHIVRRGIYLRVRTDFEWIVPQP